MDNRNNNQNFGAPRKRNEPFELNINFDDDAALDDALATLDDIPASKGEVYFSNPPAANRENPTTREKKPRNKQSSKTVMILVAASLIVSLLVSWIGITALRDIFAVGRDPHNTTEIAIVLAANLTTDEVINILVEEGLVQQRWVSQLYARFTWWITYQNFINPQPPVYLAGVHMINPSWGLEEMLEAMRVRRGTHETVMLNFPENFTARQIINRLHDNRVVNRDALMRAMDAATFEHDFFLGFDDIENADLEARFFRFEGYFFPDTYEFYVNESPVSVLTRFFNNFNNRWNTELAQRARELGMSVDEVVILASIIQMEAGNQAQMADISSVFHNRLNNPDDFPQLQADSTFHYVINNIAPAVTEASLVMFNDRINTHTRTGLPASPIGNPGMAALEAALWPNDTDFFFFLHDTNGQIYLSRTQQEHENTHASLVRQGINQ